MQSTLLLALFAASVCVQGVVPAKGRRAKAVMGPKNMPSSYSWGNGKGSTGRRPIYNRPCNQPNRQYVCNNPSGRKGCRYGSSEEGEGEGYYPQCPQRPCTKPPVYWVTQTEWVQPTATVTWTAQPTSTQAPVCPYEPPAMTTSTYVPPPPTPAPEPQPPVVTSSAYVPPTSPVATSTAAHPVCPSASSSASVVVVETTQGSAAVVNTSVEYEVFTMTTEESDMETQTGSQSDSENGSIALNGQSLILLVLSTPLVILALV